MEKASGKGLTALKSMGSGRTPQVFISYGKEDTQVALDICHALEKANCKVWLDKHQLRPGTEWKREIKKAIQESDYFLALLSSRSLSRRGFIHTELKEALAVWSETPYSKVYLIPVRVDDCDLSNVGLADLHWLDLFDHNSREVSSTSWITAISRILESVSHGRGYSPDALSAKLLGDINVYREEYEEFEQNINQTPRNMLTVLAATHARGQFADKITTSIFEHVCREGGFLPTKFVLIARGGFAHGYLTRASDIDITLLHSQSDIRDAQKVFDVFSLLLADALGELKVAAIINTVDECINHWQTDFRSLVAFSSTRFLCGNFAIYTDLLTCLQEFIVTLDLKSFKDFLERQRFFVSVEPSLPRLLNVKFCSGGLMEIACVSFLEKLLKEHSVDTSCVKPDNLVVERAHNFMLRLREDVYLTTKSNAVTATEFAIVAARIFQEAQDPVKKLLFELNRHRMAVRDRLNGLFLIALNKAC